MSAVVSGAGPEPCQQSPRDRSARPPIDPILPTLWALVAAVAGLAWLASRLGVPAPLLLVAAGLAIAFVPGLPALELPPDLVLLVLLPPIVYVAAVTLSWPAFRVNLRPILLLAIGCVLATTLVVAWAGVALLGLPLAVAFVLGAIVSPPDTVAPLAVAERLGVPKRIVAILEGEGLANDATALVLLSLALAAATTGHFSWPAATGRFATVLLGETAFGLLVGWSMLWLRDRAGEPRIEVLLSLLTPFAAFWPPHAVGGSGVLATVVAGLYVGAAGVRSIRSDTRLQAVFVWDVVNTTITGAIFLATGLSVRAIVAGLDAAALAGFVVDGLLVSAIVVAVRFAWVFPATYLPRRLFPAIGRDDPAPHWSFPFAIAFTGLRGVVSLAAALGIPTVLATGAPFPERARLLVVTFTVILVTLLVQGPLLPAVMRRLRLVERGRDEREEEERRENDARIEAARAALERLEAVGPRAGIAGPVLEALRTREQRRIRHLERSRDDGEHAENVRALELELVRAERERLLTLVERGSLDDDGRRRIEREIDLAEERVRRNVSGLAA